MTVTQRRSVEDDTAAWTAFLVRSGIVAGGGVALVVALKMPVWPVTAGVLGLLFLVLLVGFLEKKHPRRRALKSVVVVLGVLVTLMLVALLHGTLGAAHFVIGGVAAATMLLPSRIQV
ncbi:MAG: hypothetical protein QM708_01830 [Propioniciclava sp.]|uniref:hypothetical protein n=1 Tax=Propioniciclava sp. TaxID=2038686 RepID=UPI0039E4F9F4